MVSTTSHRGNCSSFVPNRYGHSPCGGGPAERPLLPSPAPSVTAVTRLPAYTGVNRHASGIRIELMDSMVPVEALVCGVNHPRQGMPVCSGCPCAGSNPRRGFMFNGLPKHCRARCATPHGVVGAAASPTATDREPLTGFGGAVGNVLALQIWKP